MKNPLSEWLKKHHVTQGELASRLGITQGQVSRLARSIQTPGLEIAVALERETGIPHTTWVKRIAAQ